LATINTTTAGAINYNGGTAFAGPTTTAVGGTYSLFMIGWSGGYATPALAAASGQSAVGWSAPFSYTATALTAAPNLMGVTAFGVAGVIPEPTTMALAGLGGLALLAIRRRK
jgi:hypothetical protein